MKCEKCGKNEATFFYEENVNGKKRSLNLCGECAAELQKKGEIGGFYQPAENPFSLFDGVSDFFGDLFALPHAENRRGGKKCPSCGAAWEDLAESGKLRCPDCYKTFGEELSSTLHALHGSLSHVGRLPARARAEKEKEKEIARLREKLKKAIAEENFEEAAGLRDEIRGLEG